MMRIPRSHNETPFPWHIDSKTGNLVSMQYGSASQHILQEVIDQVQSRSLSDSVGVVFDLDSTLFCVSPRSQAIIRSLAEVPHFLNQYGVWAHALREAVVHPTEWGIKAALLRLNLNAPKVFYEDVRDYWAKHFFSSHHLHLDLPYPGALEYVHLLDRSGAEVFYLTGRDHPQMGAGTLSSLRTWNFPLKSPSHLMMKPDSSRNDAEFKKDVLSRLKRDRALWFFENEPVIINLVRKEHPDIQMVFMDSVHSGKEIPPSDLPTIKMSFEW